MDHIPAMANQLNVDLLVVGHRPQGMLARWWLRGASNTYALLDQVRCSIHVAMDQSDTEA
jgi:nucleotide-binding universal stress UspA family protein